MERDGKTSDVVWCGVGETGRDRGKNSRKCFSVPKDMEGYRDMDERKQEYIGRAEIGILKYAWICVCIQVNFN